MSVYLVQMLCPARHCLMAAALESESLEGCRDAEQQLPEAIDALITARTINPWCELCKAPRAQWHTETGRTPYATMEEAEPHLRASEAEQRASAEQIKSSRN